MLTAKVEKFVKRILRECEEEGLTIGEVIFLPQHLKHAIDKRVYDFEYEVRFKAGPQASEDK